MTVLTKKQTMNTLNAECGVDQMEGTGNFFSMKGRFVPMGLFE
jgi:hypothetical protein